MSEVLRCSVEVGLETERRVLDRVHAGALDGALLFWRPSDQALVMPRKFGREAGVDSAAADVATLGWPVLLRDTGGEPVPQSAAVLNVVLAYAMPAADDEQARIETAYQRLCLPMCKWLRAFGLEAGTGEVAGAFCDGRFNVTLEHRKLAGTAQRWRRRPDGGAPVVLCHAAVLLEDQREAMVEVVNAFYAACGLATRCQSASHIALGERAESPWTLLDALRDCYRETLAQAGINVLPA